MKSYTWLIVLGIVVALLGALVLLGGSSDGWHPLLIGLVAAAGGWKLNADKKKQQQ